MAARGGAGEGLSGARGPRPGGPNGLFGARLRAHRRGRARRAPFFVDQFEALYALGAGDAERAAFLACLRRAADDASSPLRGALAPRADFFERLATDPAPSAEVWRALVVPSPLGREGPRDDAAREKLADPTTVLALLRELEASELPRGWAAMADEALRKGVARAAPSHPDVVYRAAFSPDGTRVVSAPTLGRRGAFRTSSPCGSSTTPKLWAATTYCPPAERRAALLGVLEARARDDEGACRRVAA